MSGLPYSGAMTLRPLFLVAVGVSAWCADPQPPARPARPVQQVPQQQAPRVAVPAPRPNVAPARPAPVYRQPAPAVAPRVAVRPAAPPRVQPRVQAVAPSARPVVVAPPARVERVQSSFASVRVVQHVNYRPVVVLRVHEKPPIPYGIERQREIAGAFPGPGYVFIPGYYTWTSTRYVWVDPTWMAPPVAGAIWIAPQWTFDDGQWNLHEGYWQDWHLTEGDTVVRTDDDPAEPVARVDAAEPAAPLQNPVEYAEPVAPPARANEQFVCSLTVDGTIRDGAFRSVPDPQHSCSKLLEYVDGRGWVNLWENN